jgi:hypothetical protein
MNVSEPTLICGSVIAHGGPVVSVSGCQPSSIVANEARSLFLLAERPEKCSNSTSLSKGLLSDANFGLPVFVSIGLMLPSALQDQDWLNF